MLGWDPHNWLMCVQPMHPGGGGRDYIVNKPRNCAPPPTPPNPRPVFQAPQLAAKFRLSEATASLFLAASSLVCLPLMALYGVAASAAGLAPTISTLAAPTLAVAAAAGSAAVVISPALLAQFSAATALSLLVASAALSRRYGGGTKAAATGGDKVRMVYQGVPPSAGASGSVTGNCQLLLVTLPTTNFSEAGMCEVEGQFDAEWCLLPSSPLAG